MKKAILFIILSFVFLPFTISAADATTSNASNPTAATTATTAAPKATTQASLWQNIGNALNNIPQWIIDKIVIGAFTLFIYCTTIVMRIFNLFFGFIKDFIFITKDWGNFEIYPAGRFQTDILPLVKYVVYLCAWAFLGFLFLKSLMAHLIRGDSPYQAMINLFFAVVLLAAYSYIYSQLFVIFYYITNHMHTLATWAYTETKGSLNDGNAIMNTLLNISSFMGNTSDKGLTAGDLWNTANTTGTEIKTISDIVTERLKDKDFAFFINQVLIFIIGVVGIISMWEVVVLKGAQVLNLFITYFTGIFACVMVGSEESKGTFWNWLKKTAQLFGYGFFWGLIIIAINMFTLMINQTTLNTEKVLYFIVVLAGMKFMSKVPAMVDDLVANTLTMQGIGKSMTGDMMNAGKIAATAAGFSLAAAAAGAAPGMTAGALTLGNAAIRTAKDSSQTLMEHMKDINYEKNLKNNEWSGSVSRAQSFTHMANLSDHKESLKDARMAQNNAAAPSVAGQDSGPKEMKRPQNPTT
jgi:hypothetical protein